MWTDFPLVFQMKPFSLIVLTRGDCIQVSSVCKSNEVQADAQGTWQWGQQTTLTLSLLSHLVAVDHSLRKLVAPEPRQK